MSEMKNGSLYSTGMHTRRLILGEEYVERVEAAKTQFDEPFQRFITETAWGSVWSRPHWTKRERSIVTVALLAALGHLEELSMHVQASARTGATDDDFQEAMLHVAVYAGIPAANEAMRRIKEVLASTASASPLQKDD